MRTSSPPVRHATPRWGRVPASLSLLRAVLGSTLAALLAACQPMLPQAVAVSTPLYYPSRGIEVPAMWVKPDGNAGRHPVVIMAHGHGGSRDEAGGFSAVAEGLAHAGIASLRMDFSGCGASRESFRHNTLDNMVADVGAALDWVRSRPDVDATRIGLLGYSMGGRIVMMIAGPERPAAVALWAPVADNGAATMEAFVGGSAAWRRLKDIAGRDGFVVFTTLWGQQQELSHGWFANLESSRPGAAFAGHRGPLLLVYGEADNTVPATVAQNAAASAGSTRVEVLAIPGAGHALGFYSNRPAIAEKVSTATVSFFVREL